MSVVCANCSATLPDGAKFCGDCGVPLAPRCPSCGTAATRPGQRYCLECGTQLSGAAPESGVGSPSSAPGPSDVERRQVSVLFADLTGFTSFSEARDAEDVRETLSEYFAMSRRVVGSYGGRVEKFIGDAVMALWGAPIAHEDDAERAVRAGLDLAAGVTALGDRLGLELRVRVGVLTGVAAVELAAIDEGMVIGDAINTASRIQSLAPPGTVLVDDVTRAVTDRAIAYEDAGAHVVKGKSAPVHTWRAVRVVAAVGGAGRRELEPPLVGRDEEIATLRGALDSLVAGRGGLRLVTVIGDPGLGKSRLAWEFKKYADGLAAMVLWHFGQAVSFGHGAGFSALEEMMRARAEIEADEPASAQSAKIGALVGELFGASDSESARRVARGLERLLGLDDGQAVIELGELFTSWRLLFTRLADQDPVVLLFEDLQWADQGLFDFIRHLTEWASGSQILVLVFSRPHERVDDVAVLGERIDLKPLSDREIEGLVDAFVADAPKELLGSVREHAAGVPLFAVESLRMLADRGVMVAEGDGHRYRLVGGLGELEVPPTIHALIAARLDRLGELERNVLRAGAILGLMFAADAAAAVAGVGDEDARSLLEGLVAKQFLAVDTESRSLPHGAYAFVHRQVQRVVLSTLSRRERKVRHLAAADFLSRRSDPDLAARLAGHLTAALGAQPAAADADQIRRRALGLTLDAAERADAVGALNEAIELFAGAAEIETDERRRADHLVRAARCAERYGNQEAVSAAHYGAARQLHERAGRTREALRLQARELYVYQWSRPSSELTEPLRAVYDRLSDEHDGAFADAAALLANTLYNDGHPEAAQEIAAQAADAAQAAGAYKELGVALNCRASALIELGRPVQALAVFQEALAIRERHAPSDVPATLGNLAVTFAALGSYNDALLTGRQAMAAAERVASRAHRNLAALHVARAQYSLGRWDEAVAAVREVADESSPATRGMLIGPPLLVAVHRGNRDRARRVIEEFDAHPDVAAAFESDYRSLREVALAHLADAPPDAAAVIARAQSGDYAEWPTWLPLAIDVLARHDEDQALRDAVTALSHDAVPKTSPVVSAQLRRLQALLAVRSGDPEEATEHWSDALQLTRSAGMVFDEAALAVEMFEQVPTHPDADARLQAATDTFSKLRAQPWLRRARAAARGRVPQH